jgi:hypothetical protein
VGIILEVNIPTIENYVLEKVFITLPSTVTDGF